MSRKLNESQLIAVHLLASGKKGCEVARHLNIRKETLSRWKQDAKFNQAIKDTSLIILDEIIDTYKNILILSQKIILDTLQDDDLELIRKASIALRFISLMRGKDDLADKSVQRRNEFKSRISCQKINLDDLLNEYNI